MFGTRVTGTGRRRHLRREALHAASVGVGRNAARVVARDIAEGGVRLYGAHLPHPGDRVAIAIGPIEAVGRVRWNNGPSCGIAFLEPLQAGTINQVARKDRRSL